MGDIADQLIDDGIVNEALHARGECEFGCPICAYEEEEAEQKRQARNRKRRM